MITRKSSLQLLVVLLVALALGCESRPSGSSQPVAAPPSAPSGSGGYGAYGYGVTPDQIQFHDNAQSNATGGESPADLQFVDTQGAALDLKSFAGKKNLVIVITRGGVTPPCVYCSTQTSRLIANYDEIAKRDAEVVVVFPLSTASEKEKYVAFTGALAREIKGGNSTKPIPFPIVVDPELKAVKQLGLIDNLSKPATYILDKDGKVRFAYVGASVADRPSVKAILAQLDNLQPMQGQ